MAPGPEVEPGTSIAVYWDLDRKWYNAEVLNYDPVTGNYKLLYADGEREELDLSTVKYRLLWAGKLRDMTGKAGGDIARRQSIEFIVKTLLDIEDRLPPKGVHNNRKRWWSEWHARVKTAGKSGNIVELMKASVEIAFQMNDSVTTSWWQSQRSNWQSQVELSTTTVALSSRLTDLLTKAVDWNAARLLFSLEHSESDRKKRVVAGPQHKVTVDRPGGDEKGTTGSEVSAREQRMMERERRDGKNSMELDEDSPAKKSISNSAENGLRRSKRKRVVEVEDEDELSHVDSPPGESGPSIVKRVKGGRVDEGHLSDPIQHQVDRAHSVTDTREDQSSVVETTSRKDGRKGISVETRKHKQGTEDGQGSGIDLKTHIGYSRVRRSLRSLGSHHSEAGQTSETDASERNVASVSNEPIQGAGNSIYLQDREETTELKSATISIGSLSVRTRSSTGMKSETAHEEHTKFSRHEECNPTQECGSAKNSPQQLEQVSDVRIEREESTELKGATISIGSLSVRTRSSTGMKNETAHEEHTKVSRHEECTPTQECGSAKNSPQQLEQVSDVRIETKRGRPKRARTNQLSKEDGDVKGTIKNSAEFLEVKAEKIVDLSAQDSNVVPLEAIVTPVATRLQKTEHTEDEIDRSSDPGRVEGSIKPHKCDAVDESPPTDDHVGLSALDSHVVPQEAVVTRIETGLQKAGHTGHEIDDRSGDSFGRVNSSIEHPKNYDAVDESFSPADDHVGVSAQDSNAVPKEAIETRQQRAGQTEDKIGRSGDPAGRLQRIIRKPQRYEAADESLNPIDDHVGDSALDSSVVPRKVSLTQVVARCQKAGHTEDETGRSGDPAGRLKRIIRRPQRYDGDESPHPADYHAGVSAQGYNVVQREAGGRQVVTRLQNGPHIVNEIGVAGGPAGRVKRTSKKPQIYDAADEFPKPHKVQHVGKQGTKLEVKQGTAGADAGVEDGNTNAADKEKVSLGRKAVEAEEREDGAEKRPNISDSSAGVRQAKRGRLVLEVSESELNEKQGVQGMDPSLLAEAERQLSSFKQVEEHSLGTVLQDVKIEKETAGEEEVQELQRVKSGDAAGGFKKLEEQAEIPEEQDPVIEVSRKRDPPGIGDSLKQDIELKQTRATASIARSERIRARSSSAILEVRDEYDTEESSGEEEPNRAVRSTRLRRMGSSRNRQRPRSFDNDYEGTTSGSNSEEGSEEYEVDDDEDDEEEPEIVAHEDSWGERLPTDDSDSEDEASKSELIKLQLGQSALRIEQPEIIGDEKCVVCDFAGADELMLLCDHSGCICALHTFCLNPPLKAIPEGEWFCPKCTRVRANPSDTGRLPKTVARYPSKVLGSIIGRRREPSQEEGKTKIQYLVKWDSLSHEHDTWVPEDWLLYMHNRLVTNFQRKYSLLSESNFNVDERRPEWLQVDRIIACRKQGGKVPVKPSQVSALLRSRQEESSGVEFLVKWRTLEHKGATWEQERKTAEFQQAIACYTERHERVEESASMKEKLKPVPAIKKQPDYLSGGTMHAFQLHGLRWLLSNFEQRRSVILADEMGLGKTIQSLAFISCVRYEKLSPLPVLVIAPKSTLPGWEQEFRCWAPGLNVIVYQGDKDNRAVIREYEFHSGSERPLFEVLLTSYELAAFDNSLLSRFHWASLIVDEGHRVKNVRSKLGTLLKRHKADFRLLLTGTPVQNTLTELFALLHFLDPKEFPDPEYSAHQFTEMDISAKYGQSDSKVVEQQVAKLHELLNPRMLRRLKTEVLRDMIPGKKVVEVSCALTPLQRHLYIAILKKNFKVLNKGVKSGLKRGLQMILTDLKMVCNHPYLFPGKEPQNEPSKAFTMLVAASGKLQLLEKLLPLLKEQGHRVLLFSQMTRMLDILEDFLAVLGLSYSRIDGSCSALSRQTSIQEFNAANSSTFIFLISTRAGGLGINLPTADTVIIYDPDFNPFVDLQAQARAHRIGQDKTVLVYQLISKCSIEEKILQRSRKKLAMENLVMSKESQENTADINTLLLHGAKKVLDENDIQATSIEFTDESVKKLLDREFLTSTTNADEPTAHGYLGAVQGAGFSSPTVNEQENKELKGGDGNEWHELLRHLVEQDEHEELGRGKRVRKQVVYAAEGHLEAQEEEEYNPSSNDSESSSDSELSMDLEGATWKAASARRNWGLQVGDVSTMEYPGISGSMSGMIHKAGSDGLFVPGGGNVPVRPLPLNSPLHGSMLSARGNSSPLMRSSGDILLPLPSQGTASFGAVASPAPNLAYQLRELGSIGGHGSASIPSLPHTSRGASSSHVWPLHTNRTMLGDQAPRMQAGAGAVPSTTFLSGPGLNNRRFVSSPVPFPGVYPYTNNVNSYAVPSYPEISGLPYTNYNVHPLPSHPLPSQFFLADARVDPQNLTTANPAWANFSHLQQASQGWRIPDVEQMSAPAVANWSAGGGYMLGGHHGSTGGHQLPTTSSSSFQSTPSSVQSGSGAAHQSVPNLVKNKRVSDSSHLSSAAAAPWLAGYCTVSNSLSRQVEPQVVSPSLATPPVPVPAMPRVAYVPALCPAFELHDPTVLQVPPAPINMSSSIRVLEPHASRTSGIVHSVTPALSSKGTVTNSYPHPRILTPPRLDFVKPIPPLDRNVPSCTVSPAEAPVMTSPHVGAAVSIPAFPPNKCSTNRSPDFPMPQTLQRRAREVPASEAGARVVYGTFLGGVPTGHGQPALAAIGKQTVTGKGSNILSAHQVEGSGPAVAPKVMPQGRKPLWVPQGDAGLLMGQSQDQGVLPSSHIKVKEGSSHERSVLPSPQIIQKK